MKIVTTSKEVFDTFGSVGEWIREFRPDGSQRLNTTNFATEYFEFVLYVPEQVLKPHHLMGYVDQLPFIFISKGETPAAIKDVILGQRSVLLEV
jgi:hypothetical protein